MPENTGNISYSLNKNNFYAILSGANGLFLPYYYGLIFLLYIYLITIRFRQYFYPERNKGFEEDKDIIHFFKSLTYNSPFSIMNLREESKKGEKGEERYVGFTTTSYLYLIVGYVIGFMIVLKALIRNYLFSIYTSIIQVNPHNNPYNNPNCIIKTGKNSYYDTGVNYSGLTSLCGVYIVPFLIPFCIWMFDFDNYDIKHSSWFPILIIYLLFFPAINIYLTRGVFNSEFSIIPDIKKYLDVKDSSFVDFILDKYNSKIYNCLPFLFIIFVYSLYIVIMADYKFKLLWDRIFLYLFIIIVICVFIPIFITFFVQTLIFSNRISENNSLNNKNDIINDMKKNGVSSLYQLLIKYNYPCFKK